MNNNVHTSIVIPSYRREKMLVELLSSIQKHTNGDDFEIIIVDDGSPEPEKKEQYVRQHTAGIPYSYLHQKNSGPAQARNYGVSVSRGKYIVFLDDDIEVTENWLSEITNGYRSANVAGIAGYTKEYKMDTLVEKYLAFVEHLHKHQFNKSGELDYVCTANCSFLKSAFLDVGGFSNELKLPAGDDMDLGFKLAKKNYTFVHNPKAVALHKHRSTLFGMFKLFFISGRGAYRCAIMHKDHNKARVTRTKLFDPLLIFKTVANVIRSYQLRMKENPKFSKKLTPIFILFEITNHCFYQLGRYYEFALMRLKK